MFYNRIELELSFILFYVKLSIILYCLLYFGGWGRIGRCWYCFFERRSFDRFGFRLSYRSFRGFDDEEY